MIAAAEAAGRPWRLVYGGRSRASMAFTDELERHGDRVTLCPQDETGLIDLDALLGSPQPGTHVYCCGPEPLLRAVEEHMEAWPAGSLHLERFTPRSLDELGPARPFEAVLARSGATLQVPADRSLLEVLEEAGVFVLSSCREGTCGTCETRVLDGQPEHRDSVLGERADPPSDSMLVCVSRCAGRRIVLDL